jgi:hypothetical protein
MITVPGNVRVWPTTGHTDMRRGFRALSLLKKRSMPLGSMTVANKLIRECSTSRVTLDREKLIILGE